MKHRVTDHTQKKINVTVDGNVKACIQWNIHRLAQYVTQASSKHHVEIKKKKSKIQSIIGIKKVTNKYNSPMIPIQCIQWNIHRLVQYVTQASSKHHVEI